MNSASPKANVVSPKSFSKSFEKLNTKTESFNEYNHPISPSMASTTTNLSLKEEINLKKEMKRLEEEEQFTYHPNITSSVNSLKHANLSNSKVDATDNSASIFQKLYSDAKKKKEKLQVVTTDQYSFKPEINRSSSRNRKSSNDNDNSSVSERLYALSLKPNDRLNNSIDLSTFKPKITKRAQSVDRKHQGPATERLYNMNKSQIEKDEISRDIAEAQIAANFSFTPELSPRSRAISAARNKNAKSLDVYDRLLNYEEAKSRRLEKLREDKEQQELSSLTLKPNINENSKRAATPTRKGDIFERLSSTPLKSTSKSMVFDFDLEGRTKRSSSVSSRRSMSASEEDIHERLFKEAEELKKQKEKLVCNFVMLTPCIHVIIFLHVENSTTFIKWKRFNIYTINP